PEREEDVRRRVHLTGFRLARSAHPPADPCPGPGTELKTGELHDEIHRFIRKGNGPRITLFQGLVEPETGRESEPQFYPDRPFPDFVGEQDLFKDGFYFWVQGEQEVAVGYFSRRS